MALERIIDALIAILSGGLTVALVSLYRARAQNRVDGSTESLNQANAWKILLEQMQDRLMDQQKEISELEQEIAERDGYIEKVISLLNKNGIETPTYVFRRRSKRSK